MGKVKTQPKLPPPMTFEQIWALLQESAKQRAEADKRYVEWQEERKKQEAEQEAQRKKQEAEQEARRKKQDAEWEARRKKRQAEADEKFARHTEEIDRMTREMAKENKEGFEQIRKDLQEVAIRQKATDKQLSGLGGRFGEMIEYMVRPNLVKKFQELGFVFTKVYPEADIKDEKHKILAEVDLTLENGDKVMIVEVKSKPTIADVKDHLKRMEKVRRHADVRNDNRTYLGAVAGMVIRENVWDFILKNGFYVIEPSGETFTITPPKGKAREW